MNASAEVVYVVGVSYPLPTRRARLAAFLRRRRVGRVALVAYPPCPECAAPVERVTPLIRQGDVYRRGIVHWKGPDTCVGHRLEPCGHRVRDLRIVAS